MALVPCRMCKHEVAADAKSCPQCGTQNPALTQQQVAGQGCLVIIIFIIFVSICVYFYFEMGHKQRQYEIDSLKNQIELNRSLDKIKGY